MSSYLQLAEQLSTLSESIRTHSDLLRGEGPASAAVKLEKAAMAFQKLLAAAQSDSDPVLQELRLTLRSEAAIRHLDARVLAGLARPTLGTAFRPRRNESDDAARERFVKVVSESGEVKEMLEALRRSLELASIPLPDQTDANALRNELRRLGALKKDEQIAAVENRLKGSLLVVMLQMAGFKPSARGTVTKKKMAEFLQFCTSLSENTAWRAA